jgi:hypothetical protein
MSEEREVKIKEMDEPDVEESDVEAHAKSGRQADETVEENDVEAHVKHSKDS